MSLQRWLAGIGEDGFGGDLGRGKCLQNLSKVSKDDLLQKNDKNINPLTDFGQNTDL